LSAAVSTSGPNSTITPGATSKFSGRPPGRRWKPISRRSRYQWSNSGEKFVGSQPSAISADSEMFFGPSAPR
jgi:hypothetical protein